MFSGKLIDPCGPGKPVVADTVPMPCIPGPHAWLFATHQVDTDSIDRPRLVVPWSTLRVMRPFDAYCLAAAGCAEAAEI